MILIVCGNFGKILCTQVPSLSVHGATVTRHTETTQMNWQCAQPTHKMLKLFRTPIVIAFLKQSIGIAFAKKKKRKKMKYAFLCVCSVVRGIEQKKKELWKWFCVLFPSREIGPIVVGHSHNVRQECGCECRDYCQFHKCVSRRGINESNHNVKANAHTRRRMKYVNSNSNCPRRK